MTILWLEGFEGYGSLRANMEGEVYEQGACQGISSNNSRWPNMVGASFNQYSWLRKDFLQERTTLVVGMAITVQAGAVSSGSTYPIFALEDGASVTQVKLYLNSDGEFVVANGDNGVQATSTVKYSPARWQYLEMKVYMHATAGTVEVRKNMKTIINATSLDTLDDSGSSGGAQHVHFGPMSGSGLSSYLDDIYVDTANFLGDIRVDSELPTADGTHTDFAPSAGNRWECVNEDGANGDTDYVEASGVGNQATFKITAPTINNAVKGIMLMPTMRRTEPGNAAIKTLVRQSSTDYLNALEHDVPAGSQYNYLQGIWETDPNDSNPWTTSKLNSAEFGVEITAYTTTSTTTTTTTTA